MCVWRCLTVHYREERKQREKLTTREALNLARKYYENPTRPDSQAERCACNETIVDMEGISRKFNINIRIFEPRTNSEKAPWRLVYGYDQCRKERKDDINLGLLAGHCFYIKKMDVQVEINNDFFFLPYLRTTALSLPYIDTLLYSQIIIIINLCLSGYPHAYV